MSDDYFPGDQTVAAKMLSFLYQIPDGAEVTTPQIAEAMNVEYQSVIGANSLVNSGYATREKAGNRYFWRRGTKPAPDPEFLARHPIFKHLELDFVPRVKNEPEASGGAKQIQVGAVMAETGFNPGPPQAKPAPTGLGHYMEPRPVTDVEDRPSMLAVRDSLINDPPPQRKKTEMMRVPVSAHDMLVGIFSDGSLSVQRKGKTAEVYTPEEVVTLVRFLDRMMLKNGSVNP